jgi:phage FluMu gp28-like protein
MAVQSALLIGEVREVSKNDFPPRVTSIPTDLNPLADGILMQHQKDWLADDSPLKLSEKGRRAGITWAEALDDCLIAAASKSAGGDSVYYIPDVKEKGLEFIGYCKHFLKFIDHHQYQIEEFLEEIVQEDDAGNKTIERISAYRIICASGNKIVALSSRPSSIRGLQGVVVIDEVAFHMNPALVIDACNALLIWGGRIRLISTHNGATNAFNELIQETQAGKWPYSLHRCTFYDAVENGLYERVCLIKGWTPSAKGKDKWYNIIIKSYGTRKAKRDEELGAIPADGEGQLLALTWIEGCMKKDHVVLRWKPPADDFVDWPEEARTEEMNTWLIKHVAPVLEKLPPNFQHFLGEDFAMRNDQTSFAVGHVAQNLDRICRLIVELRQCPYEQQKQALFFIIDGLPHFVKGILDANGNGMVLAQVARQKYGVNKVQELMPNEAWLREFSSKFRTAFEDRTIEIPNDKDVRDDLRLFELINGVGKIPKDVRTNGVGGEKRHGDSAISLLNFHAATYSDNVDIDFHSAGKNRIGHESYQSNHQKANHNVGFGAVSRASNRSGYR